MMLTLWLSDPNEQMVQGLHEEMQGLKAQLKRRRSSVEGVVSGRRLGGGGSGRHSRECRASRSRRSRSSSPSGAGSDHDSRSGEWSSSGDETAGREGTRSIEDVHRSKAPVAMGTVHHGGYYPYHPPPPRAAYPYMPSPPGYYCYGGPPPPGAAPAYPVPFPGIVHARREREGVGSGWQGHRGRSEKRRRSSGSEYSRRDNNRRSWDEERHESSSTRGVGGRSSEIHDSNEYSSGGVTAVNLAPNRGCAAEPAVERVAADGNGNRGGESEAGRGRGRSRGKRGAGSARLSGAGPRESKRHRHSDGDNGRKRYPRDGGYRAGGGISPRLDGIAYPPAIGAGLGNPMISSAPPPPLAGAGGGYAHASPYQFPPDPQAVYHEQFSHGPGWGGNPYVTTVHPHLEPRSYEGDYDSRRRYYRMPFPEGASARSERSMPRADDRGGGDQVGLSLQRDTNSRSRSRSHSRSHSRDRNDSGGGC